jgi:hypothetical protein
MDGWETSRDARLEGKASRRRSIWRISPLPILTTLLAGLIAMLLAQLGTGCSSAEPRARAKQITSRAELIGGPGALGEVGDFLLENDRIRVIIQGAGFSRGFGVYGGGLIDADLQRPVGPGGQAGGHGRDQFGELFPIFFLQALVPDGVAILSDGSDGGPARIRTWGEGGEFLTLTKALNQAVLNSHELEGNLLDPRTLDGAANLEYETVYELAPGDRHVTMTTRITNISGRDLAIPSPTARSVLDLLFDDLEDFDVPMGAVLLFGAGNRVFTPGAGFDLQFTLQDAYRADLSFPALPGVITPLLATASRNGISYAYFIAPDTETENFVASRQNEAGQNSYEAAYPGVTVGEDSMLVPFVASAFTGVFHTQSPRELGRDASFEFKSYFSIGGGDVASALEPYHRIRGSALGKIRGQVFDETSLTPVSGVSVVILDHHGRPASQLFTGEGGHFFGRLPPGLYSAKVERHPTLSRAVPFTVVADTTTRVDLASPSPARIAVTVLDEAGQRLPAKVTVVGHLDPARAGEETRSWLFDLGVGQHWRASSMVPVDPEDPASLQYVEGESYTRDGAAVVSVRPGGPYTAYVSRGSGYDLERIEIGEVAAGTTRVHHVVLRRSVDTGGWIAADFHLHASPSLDSSLDLVDRVVSAAGEGLEFLVATDHNVVTDYRPYIERAGLERFVSSMVGVEMTTLESGHFNAFPLDRDPGHMNKGSIEWALKPPAQIFAELRAMGPYGPDETVIQVNHPRDAILGYFDQYKLDPLTGERRNVEANPGLDLIVSPTGPAFYDADGQSTFDLGFDAIEIFNGKRLDQLRSFRMPEDVSALDLDPDVLEALPDPGTVLCNGGTLFWPGVVDDWFNFLNQGHRYTALGNSDSHGYEGGDVGYPRTYVFVDESDPARVTDRDVVRAVRSGRAIVTNGPFVELFANEVPIGGDATTEDGRVDVRIRIQVPNWIDATGATLYGNGRVLDAFDVETVGGRFETTIRLNLEEDTWLVAEVRGERSLFPVVAPLEVPPVLLNDAFASIAEPFGFGGGALAKLTPRQTGPVTPYAITNPIWVDVGGDGFNPPGVPARRCEGFALVEDAVRTFEDGEEGSPVAVHEHLRPSLWFPRLRGDLSDVRTIFEQFLGHGHAH